MCYLVGYFNHYQMCFNVGYCHNFPNLATIKWLASTHQPNFKLAIGLNTQLPRQSQPQRMAGAGPTTNFMVGWKVQASHFIVAALGNHTSSHTLFQNGPLKRQGWHQGMQKDGRCSITNFIVGWKVEASRFIVAALGNHTSSHTLFQNGPLKGQGWHQGMQRMADAGSITNFIVGWKVEARHFIVAALGNHTSSPRCSKIAHWEARACIWRHWKKNPGIQKDGRCWLNHQFHGGLKGSGQPFYSGSTWKSYK